MTLFRSLHAVATASGDGSVDWEAVADAARSSVDPGSVALEPGECEAIAADVRDARREVSAASGIPFDLPETVEVQNRHHWIDANVDTFREVMAPLEGRPAVLPGIARRVNTATTAALLAFLSQHVLGQYDPLVFAENEDPGLYFVRPNIRRVAADLDVASARFRRWVAFHEVSHAAEFGAAPWLADHLEELIGEAVGALAEGGIDRGAIRELDAVMTAVEGYAEFVMDRAFDDDPAEIREKIEAKRRRGGVLTVVLRRLFGVGMKRRQYERGRAFFDAVADRGGVDATVAVWDRPGALPTDDELDHPERWIDRVG